MTEESPIILRPRDNSFELVISSIFWLALFIIFFLISVVVARWYIAIISIFFFFVLVCKIVGFYKKIYLFYPDSIVIENHKNKYLNEIRMEDVVSWNEYSVLKKEELRFYLIIKSATDSLLIERGGYENYISVIRYLDNSNIPNDKSLKPKAIIIDWYVFPLEKNVIFGFIVSAFLTLSVFWLIVREKSDSDEKIYFIGKITDINFGRRKVRADLQIEGYPNLIFNTHNQRFFSAYYYNGGNSKLVNLGKTIEIGVLKSDYDWLVKNKFIRKLQLSSNISLDVEEFKILD